MKLILSFILTLALVSCNYKITEDDEYPEIPELSKNNNPRFEVKLLLDSVSYACPDKDGRIYVKLEYDHSEKIYDSTSATIFPKTTHTIYDSRFKPVFSVKERSDAAPVQVYYEYICATGTLVRVSLKSHDTDGRLPEYKFAGMDYPNYKPKPIPQFKDTLDNAGSDIYDAFQSNRDSVFEIYYRKDPVVNSVDRMYHVGNFDNPHYLTLLKTKNGKSYFCFRSFEMEEYLKSKTKLISDRSFYASIKQPNFEMFEYAVLENRTGPKMGGMIADSYGFEYYKLNFDGDEFQFKVFGDLQTLTKKTTVMVKLLLPTKNKNGAYLLYDTQHKKIYSVSKKK